MWTDEASDLLYERISVKALKQELISNPALSRTQKHSNYKLLDSYFQLDAINGHLSNLPKNDFRVKYFK